MHAATKAIHRPRRPSSTATRPAGCATQISQDQNRADPWRITLQSSGLNKDHRKKCELQAQNQLLCVVRTRLKRLTRTNAASAQLQPGFPLTSAQAGRSGSQGALTANYAAYYMFVPTCSIHAAFFLLPGRLACIELGHSARRLSRPFLIRILPSSSVNFQVATLSCHYWRLIDHVNVDWNFECLSHTPIWLLSVRACFAETDAAKLKVLSTGGDLVQCTAERRKRRACDRGPTRTRIVSTSFHHITQTGQDHKFRRA